MSASATRSSSKATNTGSTNSATMDTATANSGGSQRTPPWSQLLIRTLILSSVVLALFFVRLAGAPLVAIEATVAGMAVVCLVRPDSHLGLIATVGIGVNWLVAVDEPSSPWSIGVATSLFLFHTALAAASAAPIGAAWSRPHLGVWFGRFILVAASAIPAWFLIWLTSPFKLEASSLVFSSGLVALACVGLWLTRPQDP